MKKLLIVLFVTFFFKTIVFAENIRDLQIEGISVGDSALTFFSEKDIKKNSAPYYKDKTYTPVENNNYPFFKTYLGVDYTFKTGDPNYIITSLKGVIDYRNKSMNDCKIQLREIFDEFSKDFSSWEKVEIKTIRHIADPTGKSKETGGAFVSEQGVIVVGCVDYAPETNWMDHLRVSIETHEFRKFLKNAYK